MRPILASFLCLLALAASAGADEIVLKNGRTLTGKIVKEDDSGVSIEVSGGTTTIARWQIESVRRSATAVAPATPAPTPTAPPREKRDPPPASKKPADGAGTEPPEAAAKSGPTARKASERTPRERLADLDAIRLAPWVEEESSHVTEPEAKSFKIVRTDGRISMKDERPATGDGIDALYIRKDNGCGDFIELQNGVRQFYWYRLFWHAGTGNWTFMHPDHETFERDGRTAAAVVDSVCKDQNCRIGACGWEEGIKNVLVSRRDSPATKERAELRKACALATGSESAGELLARYHELNVDIAFSKRPAEKIRLAMQRRDVLRDLVAACGK